MTTPNNTGAVTALRALVADWRRAAEIYDDAAMLKHYPDTARVLRRCANALDKIASPPEDAPAVDGGDAVRSTIRGAVKHAIRENRAGGGMLGPVDRAADAILAALAAAPAPAVEREAVRVLRQQRDDAERRAATLSRMLEERTFPEPPRVEMTENMIERGLRWYWPSDAEYAYNQRDFMRRFLDAILTPPAEAREDGEAADRAIALNKGSPRKDRVAALERLSTPPAEAREPVGDAMVAEMEAWQSAREDAHEAASYYGNDPRVACRIKRAAAWIDAHPPTARPQATPRDAENAVRAQLVRELATDFGDDYTAYEQGRIAEKRRCIDLLAAATQPDAAAVGKQEAGDRFCDANCVWTDHHPDCPRAHKAGDHTSEASE